VPLVRRLGVNDVFVEHDAQRAQRRRAGLDAPGVRKNLEELWAICMARDDVS